MDFPLVSVVIATFNSEKILPKTLEAIRNQSYDQDKIEILMIDGGSTDNTVALADEYSCLVYPNPKTDPVSAKLIGFQKATGKYVITIDHDEVMENKNSILDKVNALREHPECKVAFCSGYKRPAEYPLLNQYISEFGDPFSFFVYRFSKGVPFFEKVMKKRFEIKDDEKNYTVYKLGILKKPIICELCCMGTMIDRVYFEKFKGAFTDGAIFTHLFYYMIGQGDDAVAFIKNDPLVHYSVDIFKAYLAKLKWRIINNVHFSDQAENGFSGREKFQPKVKVRKLLFPLYSISIIFPVLDSIYLSITRKNTVYLLHWALCLYVVCQIVYQCVLKIFGKTPRMKSYDGKKIIR